MIPIQEGPVIDLPFFDLAQHMIICLYCGLMSGAFDRRYLHFGIVSLRSSCFVAFIMTPDLRCTYKYIVMQIYILRFHPDDYKICRTLSRC